MRQSPSVEITQQQIDAALAQRGCIAVLWSISDVQADRPDLTDEEAWEVLQHAKDSSVPITSYSLADAAEQLYPEEDEDEAAD